MTLRSSLFVPTLMMLACGSGTSADPPVGANDDGKDPLTPLADDSRGLTNVSADLDAILERGALAGACQRYHAGATDEKSRLLCGKSMFFYESFGTGGVPASLVQFLTQGFPTLIGRGFAKLGMVPDPTSTDGYPLGLA